ncbi:MAG: hypothetical protein H5T96_09045 [Tissierellales bacterium]|nr:hypothetical protein [Tissierellales bacterium]
MSKIGKISVIRRDHSTSNVESMEKGLSAKGMTRVPGTGVFKYPHKEVSGKYRTGLDPEASYIKRIEDPHERQHEIERVTKLRKKLEEALDVDLGPHSKFWNYALATSTDDQTHVQPYKLTDGDNLFNLDNPFMELTFSWLRVHPTIASSYQAWERGEYEADTQFYVADEDIENEIKFKKNQMVNRAIAKLDGMSPEKRKKVARMLGLPVSDDAKEEFVYNQIDALLKEKSFKTGTFQGLSPIEVFTRFADMQEKLLSVKDLVKQALSHSIYRMQPSGKIYEGQFEISTSEEELVNYLMDDDNQEDLIMLEKKLKGKKIALA